MPPHPTATATAATTTANTDKENEMGADQATLAELARARDLALPSGTARPPAPAHPGDAAALPELAAALETLASLQTEFDDFDVDVDAGRLVQAATRVETMERLLLALRDMDRRGAGAPAATEPQVLRAAKLHAMRRRAH